MSGVAHRGYVRVGMDVSKDAIAVAVLPPDRDVAEVDKIFHDEESVRRLIKRLGRPSELWACYEAGPTGYELHRLLTSMGVRCDVVAPSLIPKGSGDRVKTDRRDSRRLAGLHRAGELTTVAGPGGGAGPVSHSGRHGGGSHPGPQPPQRLPAAPLDGLAGRIDVDQRHERRLAGRHFEDRALASTFAHYLATVRRRDAALEAVEADLLPWCGREPLGAHSPRLAAYGA